MSEERKLTGVKEGFEEPRGRFEMDALSSVGD